MRTSPSSATTMLLARQRRTAVALLVLCIGSQSATAFSSVAYPSRNRSRGDAFRSSLLSIQGLRQSTAPTASSSSSSTEDTPPVSTNYQAPQIEIDRRRNLAIISHPDSGKTTMTEKLLLYGGALQQAGAVRQKAEQRATQSDFMEMEQERGISISSTVMNFEYQDFGIRLMDTPGHQDFSEDTYRALAAADNA